jgi:hypothetical protein
MMKKGVKEEWKQQGEDIKNIFKPTPAAEKPKDPSKGELNLSGKKKSRIRISASFNSSYLVSLLQINKQTHR